MHNDVATICNITELNWIAHRTYGTFLIRGANADASQPALTHVAARKAVMDLGDKRTLELPISAREIAEDLCHEVNSDAGEASFLGVFVCADDAPTAAELAAARARLEDFYRHQIAQADVDWERTHNWTVITDLQRRAAKFLAVEKEWAAEPQAPIVCPACGERLRPNVAVCKSCGAVLDAAKAAAFGLGGAPSPGHGASLADHAGKKTRNN